MDDFLNFIEASCSIGRHPDMVQGGGGNTSIKFEPNKMAIKASGFMLKDMTADNAYTVVNHVPIIEYFKAAQPPITPEKEDASNKFVHAQIDNSGKYPVLRPSMETGFHAVLGKVVIHTHSVYSNLINCARNNRELMADIFAQSGLTAAYIPYCNPGFTLSLMIEAEKSQIEKHTGKKPDIYLLENHGVISTAENTADCVVIDHKLNSLIKEYFGLTDQYPEPNIEQIGENCFESKNDTLSAWLQNVRPDAGFFDRILFPDQVVFFAGNIYLGDQISDKKINIDPKTGKVVYNTGQKEAITIEETLLAYLFIYQEVLKAKNQLRFIGEEDANYIHNMESEAYRRSLLK